MRLRFLRTESFRLTAIFAVLMIGAMLILTILIYLTVHRALRTELLLSSERDLAAVESAYRSEGMAEAIEVVTQLLGKPAEANFMLVETASRRRLAGNLPPMPIKIGQQVVTLPAPRSSTAEAEDRQVIGTGLFLAPGVFVFAGRDSSIADDAEEDILHSFAWVLFATLALAVGGGILLSNSFLMRLDTVTRTCRAIMAGHLADRVPGRGTKDELDRLAATINAMLDRIAGLVENVNQISSDIAHDLRTPLTRLRHRLELARDESDTVGEYELAVDRAIQDTENILSLFSALLRIGQIESGSDPIRFEKVNLSQMLTDLADLFRPAAEDTGHRIATEIDPVVTVRGDRELLSQMCSNLVENAIAHTPTGTVIMIGVQRSGAGAVVRVTDTGPGIPAEEHEKVFRRFYRLERARTTPGSGLGLALVAAIARLHGARISLSDAGPGLSVSIVFGASPTELTCEEGSMFREREPVEPRQ